MNNNSNNDWIQEYINEKKSPNVKHSKMKKPKTNYGIGFVQLNKPTNSNRKTKPDSTSSLKSITMNALLKNSLRFENVMRRDKVRLTPPIRRPLGS